MAGLSGSGKSRAVENCVKDKNTVILNAYPEDFTSVKNARRIIGTDNILKFLNGILENPYKREEKDLLYIVIDELLVLCSCKPVVQAISQLLAVGRHYGVFLIGISQVSTKTDVPFKQLFSSRASFFQADPSAYSTVLGCNVGDVRLKRREFILLSDQLVTGVTYDTQYT